MVSMKKTRKTFIICFIISFLLWFFPFIIRILFIDTIDKLIHSSADEQHTTLNIVAEITEHLNNNDKWSAFCLVFFNNLKVCFINIFGGILLGLGTLVSLIVNGFFAADTFVTLHQNGMSINKILAHTLPHSIELIGIWLSGAIGLNIAKIFIDMMKNDITPTYLTIKFLLLMSLIMTLIILIASYIEIYISIK
tara:strand:- start:117 stop:698 length:582 start_codon:yes stop_codon:yes gene_type:complete